MKKLVICIFTLFLSLNIYSQEKPKLAVIDFMPGIGVCESQVNGLSDMLINALFDLGKFSIIERTQIDKVFEEQGFQKSSLSSSQLTKVGEILGVNYILAGTVNFIVTDRTIEQTQTGMVTGEYNLDIRIVDVSNGEIIATAGVTKTNSQTYRSLMPTLAAEIDEKLNKANSGGVINLLGFLDVTPNEFEASRKNVKTIVRMLNNSNYCGYNNWSIPTSSEADILNSFGIKVRWVICSQCGGDGSYGGYYGDAYDCGNCDQTGIARHNDTETTRFVR